MRAIPYMITLFGLAILLITGCDQSNNSRTGNEAVQQERADALLADGPVESQASNALQSPGSTKSSRVSSRSLLDNIAADSDLSTFNSLLRKAGVSKGLSGTGPYTVLAPTEA